MFHTSWCVDHNHPTEDGCSTESANVGDVGTWMHAGPSAEPVVVLDPKPESAGLTLGEARDLARRLDELVTAAGEGRP
jgi:hypothetical protein